MKKYDQQKFDIGDLVHLKKQVDNHYKPNTTVPLPEVYKVEAVERFDGEIIGFDYPEDNRLKYTLRSIDMSPYPYAIEQYYLCAADKDIVKAHIDSYKSVISQLDPDALS